MTTIVAVATGADDGDYKTIFSNSAARLQIVRSPSGEDVWVRFAIDIPQGKRIPTAFLRFREDDAITAKQFIIHIRCDQEDDAPNPTDSTDAHNRWITGAASQVIWDEVLTIAGGARFNTIDIALPLQSIIDREGWAPNNHVVFYLEAEGGDFDTLRMYSYDSDPSNAPELHFEGQTQTQALPQVFTVG